MCVYIASYVMWVYMHMHAHKHAAWQNSYIPHSYVVIFEWLNLQNFEGYIAIAIRYRIAQNFDGGNFWRFWRFPARPSKFNPSNCLKTIQRFQVYGERQWPSVKIFSVKYLKSQNPSKFLPRQKFALYGIFKNKLSYFLNIKINGAVKNILRELNWPEKSEKIEAVLPKDGWFLSKCDAKFCYKGW